MIAIALILSILTEATLTTLPLTVIILTIYAIQKKNLDVLLLGFIAGIFLDIASMSPVGITSAYLVAFLSLVLMYGRKFETESIYYLSLFCLLGAFSYCLLKGISGPIPHALFATFLAVIIYKILPREEKKEAWR